MIDEALYALLAADTAVNAIVAGRIFQVEAPPDASLYPCISYTFVGGSTDNTLNDGDYVCQRVEINAMGWDASVAAQLRQAVINCVAGWRTTLADGTDVSANLLSPGIDFVNEQRLFRRMAEFYVYYTTLPA